MDEQGYNFYAEKLKKYDKLTEIKDYFIRKKGDAMTISEKCSDQTKYIINTKLTSAFDKVIAEIDEEIAKIN